MRQVQDFAGPPGRRRVGGRLGLVAVGIALCASAALASPQAASAAGNTAPLLWTAPASVDTKPIDSLTCVSADLCVGVDRGGDVLWSTAPSGGARRWHTADVDGSTELTGVSCPAASLCVAVDAAGNAVTSTAPTAGRHAWTVTRIDTNTTQKNSDNGDSVLLRDVSCPSTSLCVAVDAVGDALTSTAPTAGSAAWVATHIDGNRTQDCTGSGLACQPPLVGVSCPSTSECAAVDFAGNVLTSDHPSSAASPWSSATTDGGALSSLYGVSCPTSAFCATVDGFAGKVITFDPTVASRQLTRSLPYSLDGIWCPSRSLCLASVETEGGISGLLGSFDPASPDSTWRLSSLGGVNAVACPRSDVCLAADDEGNIAAGVTTRSVDAELSTALLSRRRLPSIAKLDRTHRDRLTVSSAIASRISLRWVARLHGRRIVAGSASARFSAPGKAHLTLLLSAAGRALFRAAKSVKVSATATFAASTGSVKRTAKLIFTRARRR